MKFLQLLRYTMIASAISSLLVVFLNINNSVMFVLMQLPEPIVAPFRRFVPNLGMIDLSFWQHYLVCCCLKILLALLAATFGADKLGGFQTGQIALFLFWLSIGLVK